jgi:hypothetical protein
MYLNNKSFYNPLPDLFNGVNLGDYRPFRGGKELTLNLSNVLFDFIVKPGKLALTLAMERSEF